MSGTQGATEIPATLAVIGGAGFLGRSLIGALAADEFCSKIRVRCLDRVGYPAGAPRPAAFKELIGDARDAGLLDTCLRGADAVWVRAGITGGAPSVDAARCMDYLDTNADLVARVMDACDRAGCRRVFFDSTGQVFGDPADQESCDPDAEPTAANFYGASKLIAEKLLRLWAHSPGDGARSVQVFRYSRVRAADTRDVIQRMCAAALAGEPIRIIGPSIRRLDFVHADDVAAANLAALRRSPRYAAWHVSAGRPVSLFELALLVREKVAARTGSAAPIHQAPASTGAEFEPLVVGLRWEASNQALGLPLPRGIDDMVDEAIAAIVSATPGPRPG